MTFLGSKFLFQVFGTLIGAVSAVILFLLSYSLFLPVDAQIGLVAGVIVVCIILGGAAAYFSYKLTKAYSVQIIGAIVGVVLLLMLSKLLKLKEAYLSLVFAIIGALAGWFLADKLRKFIKAAGTALIGSFLLVRGIGCYAPGYPDEFSINAKSIVKNPNENMELIGYLLGFIVLAVIGTIVQLRVFRVEEEDEDDNFKSEDEARVCGCF